MGWVAPTHEGTDRTIIKGSTKVRLMMLGADQGTGEEGSGFSCVLVGLEDGESNDGG